MDAIEKEVDTEGAFTLDVQIYVNTGTPERVQTVTLCNVLSFVCRCPTCGKSFNSQMTLSAHMKTHNIPTFSNVEEVVAQSQKTVDDNYTCVATVHNGEQHFIFITQDPSLPENQETETRIENKVVQSPRKRMRKNPNEPGTPLRKHPCTECNLAFPTRTKLGIHLRTHTGEKPFPCETCGKRFCTRGELTVHTRVHTGDKPYTCSECGTAHRTRSSLHGHMHRYHEEKAYTCEICNKKFSIKSYFMAHLRVHDANNPFTCNICGKAFAYKSFLEKHAKTHSLPLATENQERRKRRRRDRKAKKATDQSDEGTKDQSDEGSKEDENSGNVSTAEKEKLAVEFLQQAAGDAAAHQEQAKAIGNESGKGKAGESAETQGDPKPDDGSEALNAEGRQPKDSSTNDTDSAVEGDESGDKSKETVFEIETTKDGSSETIYVALAESDLQDNVEEASLEAVPMREGHGEEAIESTGTQVGQNVQLVSHPQIRMVVVRGPDGGISEVVMPDNLQTENTVVTTEPQVAALLAASNTEAASNPETPVSALEYARRVDAVVQELEKRINTNE